ncbi:MAG TPA: MerR family transcriptional regulator [Candidatus Aminicenantes bacterium]|nr:MerR family transcriptional regulator [Candidatus Aminicenantes bacterium]
MTGQRTIGRLAQRFGLARSTLLYYDRIGLLRPGRGNAAGYRQYSEHDEARLEQICRYRDLGIPLREIGQLLDRTGQGIAGVLLRRARQLDEEIAGLREQQRVVLSLLKAEPRDQPARALDKEAWVSLMRAAGLGEEDMTRWHVEFERLFPEAHQVFLRDIGIPAPEIEGIRRRARAAKR